MRHHATHTALIALFLASAAPIGVMGQPDTLTTHGQDLDRARQLFVRGLTISRTGDHERAASVLGEAARLAPGEPAIYLSLSESHAALNDVDAALYYARQAADLGVSVEYTRHLARMQVRAGRLEEAEATYDRVVRDFPDDADAVFERARLKVRLGREADAADSFERLIRLVGDDRILRTRLLQLYGRLNDVDGIERTLRALISLDEENPHYHLMLSDFLTRNNRTEEATAVLETALERIPDDVDLLTELELLHRSAGRETNADSLNARIMDVAGLTPDQISARAERVYVRALTDSTAVATAIELLTAGLDVDASHYQMLTMLGDLRYRQAEYAEAADLLSRALAVDPRNADLWLQTSVAYLNSDQPRAAAALGEEGIILFPGRIDLLETTAHSYLVFYENSRAMELYELALELLKDDELWSAGLAAEAHASLGFLHSRRSQYEKSDHHYRAAIKIDSTNAFALNNFAYSLATRETNLDEALDLARRAVSVQPESPSLQDTLGWILFLLDRPDEARGWLLRAVAASGNNATMLEHLGDVEHRLGLHDSARQRWLRAFELNPESTSLKDKLAGSTP